MPLSSLISSSLVPSCTHNHSISSLPLVSYTPDSLQDKLAIVLPIKS